MAMILPQFAAFDLPGPALSQRWGKWLTRFERLLVISKITEPADKRAWLFHFVGERVNDIVHTIPENGADNDYATAVRKLTISNPNSTLNMKCSNVTSVSKWQMR